MREATVPARSQWPRRIVDRLVNGALALAVLSLAVVVLGAFTGHRLLIDRSDSMRPAISAGDMLLVGMVAPDRVRAGDIVTFVDPHDRDRTITHRALAVTAVGDRLAFVTRGDANGSSESWTTARDGSVGVTRVVLPRVGFAVAWLGQPWVRFALVTVAGAMLGGIALRRIWRP